MKQTQNLMVGNNHKDASLGEIVNQLPDGHAAKEEYYNTLVELNSLSYALAKTSVHSQALREANRGVSRLAFKCKRQRDRIKELEAQIEALKPEQTVEPLFSQDPIAEPVASS